MTCVDEKVRKCILIVLFWLVDHMENIKMHGIKTNLCPICTATHSQLGMLPKTAYNLCNHVDYKRLYKANYVTW